MSVVVIMIMIMITNFIITTFEEKVCLYFDHYTLWMVHSPNEQQQQNTHKPKALKTSADTAYIPACPRRKDAPIPSS